MLLGNLPNAQCGYFCTHKNGISPNLIVTHWSFCHGYSFYLLSKNITGNIMRYNLMSAWNTMLCNFLANPSAWDAIRFETKANILDLSELQMNGATYKSRMKISAGGVGRNLAEGISKLHGRTRFISAVGDDQNGVFIRNLMPKLCITDSLIINSIIPTANCAVVLDSAGDCKVVVGDMQIHSSITPDLVSDTL